MTISLLHSKVSGKVAGSDSTRVYGTHWDAEHSLTQSTGTLLGRTTAGTGATEEITPTSPLSLSAGALAITAAALTKVDDTNVTLTLGGTPTTALLQATSITVGWSGTLALSRLAQGTDGQIVVGQTSAASEYKTMSGDATLSNLGALTLASTISAGGPIGSATVIPVITYDAKGRLTAVSSATVEPAFSSITSKPTTLSGYGITDVTGMANPSASISLTANNGSATTAMRSDATPALSQSISPTMTGNWIFSPTTGNALVLNPAANSTNLGFVITQSSPISGSVTGPLLYNRIDINHQVGTSTGGANDPLVTASARGFQLVFTEGGSNISGQQEAVVVRLNHTVGTSNAGDHIALVTLAYSNQDSTSHGIYALNPVVWAASGASHSHLVGAEFETAIDSGATVTNRTGIRVSNDSTGQGSAVDTAFALRNNGNASGAFKTGFSINDGTGAGSQQTIATTGNLFYVNTAITIDSVFDCANLTVTTNIAKFPNFMLTGAGKAQFGNPQVALSVWSSTYTVLQLGGICGVASLNTSNAGGDIEYCTNCYWDGTNWKYVVTGLAANYFTSAGTHNFRVAASGTAGNNITWINALKISETGNVAIGSAALATTATDGFLYIDTCAGTPTGTPTIITGRVPIIYDTTNHKLYIYDGGWKGGTTPGAWV